jgi:hypothetical protein
MSTDQRTLRRSPVLLLLAVAMALQASAIAPANAQTTLPPPDAFEAIGRVGEAQLRWAPPPPGATAIEVRMHVGTTVPDPSPTAGARVCRVAAPATSCRVKNIDTSKRHTFDAFAVDAAGRHGAGTRWAISGTTLSSERSTGRIRHGDRVVISGRLLAENSGVSGHQIILQSRSLQPDGTWSDWERIASQYASDVGEEPGEPDKTGEYRFTRRPVVTTHYRARYTGGGNFFGATSTVRRVDIAPVVTAKLSKERIAVGGSSRLSGSVTPMDTTRTAELQRRRADGTWAVVQTRTLSSTNTYRFDIKGEKAGKFTYRVRIQAGEGLAKGVSPARTLRVG